LTKQTVLSLRKNVCWHALKRARYVELFFSRVCTESNFSLFTFVCLRHRSCAYRDLHTSPRCFSFKIEKKSIVQILVVFFTCAIHDANRI